MGVAVLNAIAVAARWLADLVTNHQAVAILAFGAFVVTMPEEPVCRIIPRAPWKWLRDAGQTFWNSRNPNFPPPPHPTQPAPAVQDQTKPTA